MESRSCAEKFLHVSQNASWRETRWANACVRDSFIWVISIAISHEPPSIR